MFLCSNRRIHWLIVVLYYFSSFSYCADVVSGQQAVIFKAGATTHDKLARELFEQPFILEQLSYESDVVVQPEEFFYLVDLQEGSSISGNAIKRAVDLLFKKNKFIQIHMQVADGAIGKKLHMKLVGMWTFARLKLHAVFLGKDRYRQHYLMDPGDQFLESKHHRSINKIHEAFKREGYFQGSVAHKLVRDEHKKTVTVELTLSRGQRFTIGHVRVFAKKGRDAPYELQQNVAKTVYAGLVKQLRGKNYTKALINKKTEEFKKKLVKKGFFLVDIELQEHLAHQKKQVDLVLRFNFLEKRLFVFSGNHFFSDTQLLDIILLFGRSAWLMPASLLIQEIEKEYHHKGFWSVSITAKKEGDQDLFVICEGERASIGQVEIKGVDSFSSAMIAKRFFRLLVRQKYVQDELVEQCVDNLLAFYRTKGFWDVQVLKQDFVPIEGERYQLALVIDEGKKRLLCSIDIPAFPELLDRGPFAQFSKKNMCVPFDTRFIQEQQQWLKNYVQKAGYTHVQVQPIFTYNNERVKVTWEVTFDKQPITFGKTIVLGGVGFPFGTLMNELRYKEGDVWNNDALKVSLERLRSLEIFERVHLYPDHGVGERHVKDLLLKVHNDDPFEVRFRAGAGLQEVSRKFTFGRGATYKIGGTFLVKNPTNSGDLLAINIDVARSYRDARVEYIRQNFFTIPMRTSYKVYANKYQQPGFIGSKKDLYKVLQHGFLMGIRDKRRFFDIGFNIGCEWISTSIKNGLHHFADQVAKAVNFESTLLGTRVPYFFMEPVLVIDRLDDKLNPTRGSFSLITIKTMLPLSSDLPDAYFTKFLGEFSLFRTIGRSVAALRIRMGHIFHQDFKNIMPFERFYLGGANSIRSYEADLCPPLGLFKDEKGLCSVVPQGGKTMVNLNAELRFSLFDAVGLVLFQDVGTLIARLDDGVALSDLLAATGFGLRYNTPIGPLRFDIGWKWRLNGAADHHYAWFLTLGQAF